MTPGCPFCRIVAGELAADIVHSDDQCIAFRDIAPQAPVHILVIPRDHIRSVAELTPVHDGLWSRMLHVAQHLADREEIAESGYRLVTNVNADGGQTIDHLHLHLLGGRPMLWPPG